MFIYLLLSVNDSWSVLDIRSYHRDVYRVRTFFLLN